MTKDSLRAVACDADARRPAQAQAIALRCMDLGALQRERVRSHFPGEGEADTRSRARRAESTVRTVGYRAWCLVLIQGLPLFILGAVNHNRTLEIIGFALLALLFLTSVNFRG